MRNLLFVFCLGIINLVPAQNIEEGICISGNCETGFGVKKYKDGTLYIGEWWNEIPSGDGTVIWGNGTIYVGQFYEGLYNGNGTLMSNHELYIGEFKKHKQYGKGTLFFANGEVHVREFNSMGEKSKGYVKNKQGEWEEISTSPTQPEKD